jgi:uncharacterized protein (DUF2344 family)
MGGIQLQLHETGYRKWTYQCPRHYATAKEVEKEVEVTEEVIDEEEIIMEQEKENEKEAAAYV